MENEKIASEILEFEKKSYLCSPEPFLGELSSAGSERLPYKQRVGGSNPSAPTTSSKTTYGNVSRFFISPPSSFPEIQAFNLDAISFKSMR